MSAFQTVAARVLRALIARRNKSDDSRTGLADSSSSSATSGLPRKVWV